MNAVADVGLPSAPAFDTTWMKEAACRDVDTSVFFAKQPKDRLVDAAKRICAGCEVNRQCLNFAIATRAVGVWGGTTTEERRKLRPDAIPCADCGEPMAWKSVKHVRCEDCYPAYRLQQKYRWQREVGKFRREVAS